MIRALLIALLVLLGSNPTRICTCFHEDEPVLAAADGEPHPGCDCPVVEPVQKLSVASAQAPVDSHSELLAIAAEPIRIDDTPADFRQFSMHSHAPATPLYVTLRALRN